MTIIFGILLALVVFFFVVLVHEFGHFITARLFRMKVLEFGFGIPPKLKKLFTDKHGTEFTLNWLPIGGFVRIFGEDPRSPEAFSPGAFMSRSLPKRIIVLVAGVVMNFLLAWVIFVCIFLMGARPLSIIPIDIGPTHSYFLPSFSEAIDTGFITHSGIVLSPLSGSIAENAGILPQDRIVLIGGKYPTSIDMVIDMIETHSTLSIVVENTTGSREVILSPEQGKIGTHISYASLSIDVEREPVKHNLLDAMRMGGQETYATSVMTFKLLGKTLGSLLFPSTPDERTEAKNMLSGPIGVGSAFVSMVDLEVPPMIIWLFIALLSVNLGVLNIIPFPALDGGRIITTTIYSCFASSENGRKRFLTLEAMFHTLGFLLLLLLMLYVAGLDISRFFS